MEAAAASQDSKSEEEVPKVDPIVQYIVLRKDLVDTMKWPLGSVISQGCHAAVAAVWLFKDDPVTAEYCSSENLDHMHKVIASGESLSLLLLKLGSALSFRMV
jgi:peptidyl-tRNA hydrolase